MSPTESLKRTMLTAAIALAVFLSAGCAAQTPPHPGSEAPSKEVDVSEKDRMPQDAAPRPARPTCPPGMVGSCR